MFYYVITPLTLVNIPFAIKAISPAENQTKYNSIPFAIEQQRENGTNICQKCQNKTNWHIKSQ